MLQRLLSPFRASETPAAETRSLVIDGEAAGLDIYNLLEGTGGTWSPREVTEDQALGASAVWGAVQLIAGSIATLPVTLRNQSDNAEQHNHPVAALLRQPNPLMTQADFWEALLVNVLTRGNAYAWIEWRGSVPVGLYPLKSGNVEPRVINGQPVYDVQTGSGWKRFSAADILHWKGLTRDGFIGLSPLQFGRSALGRAIALDKFSEKFFENGCHVGGILEVPPMEPEAFKAFKRDFFKKFAGLENSHKIVPIPGAKIHALGFSPKDSQADEQRTALVREVCRIYQVPPHRLADVEKTTVGNSEEQERSFNEGTLRRWVTKQEQALTFSLLSSAEKKTLKIRVNLDARVRGSLKDRIDAVSKAAGGAPLMTPNEARDHLNLQPIEGGDVLQQNLNQGPAGGGGPPEQRVALLAGVARRHALAERRAVRGAVKKAAGDAAALAKWSEEWYPRHELRVRQDLDGAGVDGAGVGRYFAERRAQLSAASGGEALPMGPETEAELRSALLAEPAREAPREPEHVPPRLPAAA